ncbi:MAG TPA: hypothetical protein VFS05_02325 [Gemmatimonadaceae bacterium]|nr:hypothetical protein [Gemmatimonadaceae bacterium]
MLRWTIPLLVPCATLLLAASCGEDGAGVTPPDEQPPGDTTALPPVSGERGTIAYARGGELRLIQPDGSNDRVLWAPPDRSLGSTILGIGWKPDGTELAFSSDHEAAVSFYDRDIYAVRVDGRGLRRVTNAPAHDRLASMAKGSVTVTVQNNTADSGPYFVYVGGASAPQQVTIAPGNSAQLTFTDVADFGSVVQAVVVINGLTRWFGGAVADVRAGATTDAGTLTLTQFGGVPRLGVSGPVWSADGSRLAFIGSPTCVMLAAPASPPAGFIDEQLLDSKVFGRSCAFDWAQGGSAAGDVIYLDDSQYSTDGSSSVYRVRAGAQSRGQPVLTFTDYDRLTDIRWLPDGSGFLVAKTGGLMEPHVNLYELLFSSGTLRQITTFTDASVRGFAISPDGRQIVFERVPEAELTAPSDLWVVNRDGSSPHLLVRDAASPAW